MEFIYLSTQNINIINIKLTLARILFPSLSKIAIASTE